ncbi:MAG: hypothetical protein NC401_18640 [Ruminococcus sp.]|nr:hypothetical protein [Ruminococcus sp.]
MKRKILTILVCAAVVLTTACGKSGITSTPAGGSGESSSDKSSSSSESSSESSGSAESEGSSSAPESSTPESGAAAGFVHGTQNGNSYTSEFLGIKADFSADWTVQSDAELAATNGIADMSDENANSALDTNAILYEMYASTETNANVNIVVENLNVTNNGKSVTAEEYIDLSIGGLETSLKESYDSVEVEKSTVNFLGSEMPCINTKLGLQGVEAAQKLIPISKDAYIAIITFTGWDEEEISSMLDAFKAL